MIPLWKIQREVMRIGAQIKNLATAIVDLYELTQEPKLRRAHFAKLHERIAERLINGFGCADVAA